MAETIDALLAHLGANAKLVVWEHNSHLGDARATEMSQQGELNVGQLVRERYGREAVLIGFSTYSGTVTAANDWDEPAERKRVRPALRDSYEDVLHRVSPSSFYLPLHDAHELDEPRLERAIGVIYRPDTERMSHYFHAVLPRQFERFCIATKRERSSRSNGPRCGTRAKRRRRSRAACDGAAVRSALRAAIHSEIFPADRDPRCARPSP